MQKNRCFLCGHKMAENGLCINVSCVRSQPVTGTAVAAKIMAENMIENPESGSAPAKQDMESAD